MSACAVRNTDRDTIPLSKEFETFYDQLAAYLESPRPKRGAIRQLMISSLAIVECARDADKQHINLEKLKRDMRKLKDGDPTTWTRHMLRIGKTHFADRFRNARAAILQNRRPHPVVHSRRPE